MMSALNRGVARLSMSRTCRTASVSVGMYTAGNISARDRKQKILVLQAG